MRFRGAERRGCFGGAPAQRENGNEKGPAYYAPFAGASARTLWCSWMRRRPSGVRFTIIVSAPGYSVDMSLRLASCGKLSAVTVMGATATAESPPIGITSTAPSDTETRASALRFSEEERWEEHTSELQLH